MSAPQPSQRRIGQRKSVIISQPDQITMRSDVKGGRYLAVVEFNKGDEKSRVSVKSINIAQDWGYHDYCIARNELMRMPLYNRPSKTETAMGLCFTPNSINRNNPSLGSIIEMHVRKTSARSLNQIEKKRTKGSNEAQLEIVCMFAKRIREMAAKNGSKNVHWEHINPVVRDLLVTGNANVLVGPEVDPDTLMYVPGAKTPKVILSTDEEEEDNVLGHPSTAPALNIEIDEDADAADISGLAKPPPPPRMAKKPKKAREPPIAKKVPLTQESLKSLEEAPTSPPPAADDTKKRKEPSSPSLSATASPSSSEPEEQPPSKKQKIVAEPVEESEAWWKSKQLTPEESSEKLVQEAEEEFKNYVSSLSDSDDSGDDDESEEEKKKPKKKQRKPKAITPPTAAAASKKKKTAATTRKK